MISAISVSKTPQRVGVGDHQADAVFIHDRGHRLGGEQALLIAGDLNGLAAGQGARCGVGAMSAIGDEDLVAVALAAALEQGAHGQQPGELPLSARGGLQRTSVQSGDGAEQLLEVLHQAQ